MKLAQGIIIAKDEKQIRKFLKLTDEFGVPVKNFLEEKVLKIIKNNLDTEIFGKLGFKNLIKIKSNGKRYFHGHIERRLRRRRRLITRNGKVFFDIIERTPKILSINILGIDESAVNDFFKKTKTISENKIKKLKIENLTYQEFLKISELNSLQENKESKILNGTSRDAILYISKDDIKKKVNKLKTIKSPLITPGKLFSSIGKEVLETLSSHSFLDVNYCLKCPKCKKTQAVYNSREDAEINSRKNNCSECGIICREILKVYRLTNKGGICLKTGNWFEVYMKYFLIDAGVNPQNIKIHVFKGKKQLDVIFIYNGFTILGECKDSKLKPTDIDIFIPKAQKIDDLDYALVISTAKIAKNTSEYVAEVEEDQDFEIFEIQNFKSLQNQIEKFLKYLDKVKIENEKEIISRMKTNILKFFEDLQLSSAKEHPHHEWERRSNWIHKRNIK